MSKTATPGRSPSPAQGRQGLGASVFTAKSVHSGAALAATRGIYQDVSILGGSSAMAAIRARRLERRMALHTSPCQ